MDVTGVAAVTVCALAAAWDVTTRKIPNLLTLGAALSAAAFYLWTDGVSGLANSLAGWMAGTALFFPFFALGGMGAGDVKLLGAIGAWVGPWAAVWIALISAIAGGVLAIIVSAAHGYTRQALSNLWGLLLHWRVAGPTPLPTLTLERGAGPRLAYAIPILVGTLVALWWRS